MIYYVNIYDCGTERFCTSPDAAAATACDHKNDNDEDMDYLRTEVRKDGVVTDNNYFTE